VPFASRRNIDYLLREAGFAIDADEWVRFIVHALRARERAKHVLSRYVSAILDHITQLSAAAGLDRETMSWLRWDEIAVASHDGLVQLSSEQCLWAEQAAAAQRRHRWESSLLLSPVLVDDDDRVVATSSGVLPNFVGRIVGEGRVVVLDDPNRGRELELAESIIVTDRADPGYEWLFRRNIAGLITAWGGANSHLGIRCAEHALPAAIGCGEAFVERAMQATRSNRSAQRRRMAAVTHPAAMRIGITQRRIRCAVTGDARDSLDDAWAPWLARALPGVQSRATISRIANDGGYDGADDWLERSPIDALILSGGEDVGSSGLRDAAEHAALDHATRRRIPVIGVCRGMQFLQLRTGGSLVAVGGHVGTLHDVMSGDGVRVAVNSWHRWGIDAAPAEWVPLARADDGTIEAYAHRTQPWLGVMSHPEREGGQAASGWVEGLLAGHMLADLVRAR
jgi:GMP synthase-like glutamine amidotransferase